MEKNANTKQEKDNDTNNKLWSAVHGAMPYIIIVLVVVVIRTYIITPIKVNGTSMVDTLQNGDTMILNKISKRFKDIKRFQIVVISTDDSYLIKRVIGLPGETIKYKDGRLYINGKETKDPYYKNENTKDFDEVKIDDDSYFVLGDNRAISIDSRVIGTINKKNIIGTTRLVIFPFSDFGFVE